MIEEKKQSILEKTGYSIMNDEKLNRSIYGMVGREGQLTGGVGETASDSDILAEYDRLGGLIRKGKNNIKIGGFYDFNKRQPRKEPQVVLVFRDLEGEVVEIEEGEEIPLEVRAAEAAREKKAKKALEAEEGKAEKKAKSRKGKVDEE